MVNYTPRTYKHGVVILKPQGFLDSNNVNLLITIGDMRIFAQKKIKSIEVVFTNVVSLNLNAARFLNDVFEHFYKNDVECFIVGAKKNIYDIFLRLKDRYFNLIESEEVATVFCQENDGHFTRPIYMYIKDVENKNMILYYLIRKGYSPIVLSSKEELDAKKEENPDAICIEHSVVAKLSNRVTSFTKDNMVFFYLDGFLDADFTRNFDEEYFRRSLLIGFKVFVFDCEHVKSLNIHAVRYLSRLAVESAEYGALLCVVGLNTSEINEKMLVDMEDAGYIFFENMEEFNKNEEVKEALKTVAVANRKQKKQLTKEVVGLLPYFVNATIESVELMTGITARKEKPQITELRFDYKNKKYIASSVGFYGDLDGMLVLVFSENLTKKVSEILFGEVVEDEEELSDVVSEFANIIVGNVKANLSKQSKKIDLTLPRVFDTIDNLMYTVQEKKGAEVKFYFGDEEFYFFLTR
ncbi:MAG: chemotaxis protein CheX [Epsilonproteobacteria bacterium]|nr:chemotaxis protein CheX [Campylobacterota bacterium]